jgi:hypothetical protein
MAKISMNGHRLILSPQTLTTLALSAIEVFPNETGGQLWGKINGEIYYPEMIYPLQTGKRSPRSFDSGNQSAIKRIKDIELALRGEPFKTRFLGEYHSHCGREVSRQPSPKDLDAFDYLMKDRSQNYWLEVITNIERFSTEKPTKIDPHLNLSRRSLWSEGLILVAKLFPKLLKLLFLMPWLSIFRFGGMAFSLLPTL